MASASVNAPEQPTVDIETGTYRVASTVLKVQTQDREGLHNITDLVRDLVPIDVLLDLRVMVRVVAQRVEDLRQREVRQMPGDFLGRHAEPPELDDRADGRPCPHDDGLAAQNGVVADDVPMLGSQGLCRVTGPSLSR